MTTAFCQMCLQKLIHYGFRIADTDIISLEIKLEFWITHILRWYVFYELILQHGVRWNIISILKYNLLYQLHKLAKHNLLFHMSVDCLLTLIAWNLRLRGQCHWCIWQCCQVGKYPYDRYWFEWDRSVLRLLPKSVTNARHRQQL